MRTMLQNLRYAWRQLRRSPEFTLLAVLTLALGIGANTAMFTVVESVLLRPLPYANPDRLVYIGPAGAEPFGSTSWLNYRDIRDQAKSLESVAGYSDDVGVIQSKDASVSVVTPGVTPNLFRMLGVQPLYGRTFTESEGQTGGAQVVLLSEGLWRQVFAGDPAIVGHTVRVNGRQRTVAGVMPRSFRFPESMGQDIEKGLWLPIQPNTEMLKERGYHFFKILATVKPAVTLAQVQSELGAVAQHIRQSDSQGGGELAFRATPYREMLTGPVRPIFLALVVALALVLLIACANVANLLIARCLSRQQEFAVRAALGSGQWRLIGQTVVEGGLLSVLGCSAGFAVAYWIVAAIHRLPAGTIPRGDAIEVRWTVILVLGAIATATTLLSALLPALLAARTDPQPTLQAASRGVGTGSVRARVGGWLVAGEVALSTLLLVASGLLFRTLWGLEHKQLGFDATRVTSFTAMPADAAGFGNLTVSADAQRAPASVATVVYQPVLEEMRHAPGVWFASLVTAPPLSGFDLRSSFRVVGWPRDKGHQFEARLTAVSGGYDRLMGTPVRHGRMIGEEDGAGAPYVAAVNETLAHKYFAGRNPIGLQIDLGGKDTGMLKPYTIVGVIGDQVDTSTAQPPEPFLMLPYQQIPTTSLFYPALLNTVVSFVVKTRGDIAVAPQMRTLFRRTAPEFALDNFRTMQEAVDQSNFSARLGLYLIGAFAGLAVLMVIAGLYGVLAQVVTHRRREIGVRLALGATRPNILWMFLRQGSVIVGLGLLAGVALALSTGRLVKSFLYGVTPLDPMTYAFVVSALFVVGLVAALVPAWRAASVDPMNTLRDQ
jgi:putative ABC transport system permease protein